MQKFIYLVLSSSSSIPAKLIKFFTKNQLNHSSIAIDTSLNEMYSFGRLKMWNAFYGGFVKEDKDKGFYEKFTDTYIQLYQFPVSDEVYEETIAYLKDCYARKESFKYNLLGAILTKFNIPFAREDQYFCSEFVAKVFNDFNIRELNRDVHTYRPYYFLELENKELLYEGMLKDYKDVSKTAVIKGMKPFIEEKVQTKEAVLKKRLIG